MTHSKKDLHNRVMKELECPVCLELMVPPIRLCNNGHSLCCNCRVTLENCPICRGAFLQVRNLSLESLVPETLHPCKHAERGCMGLFSKTELKTHEPKCEHGLYKCPFASISKLDCSWSGRMSAIKKHVEKHHGDKSVQYVSRKFKTMLHNVEKSQRFYQTVITMGELFYVKWRLHKNSFHCAAFYVGPHEKASDFKYRFSITTNDGETVSGCSRTHSFLDDVESVFRQGKCIKLNHAIVQRSYTDNGHLPFRMEISKVSNNTEVNVNKLPPMWKNVGLVY